MNPVGSLYRVYRKNFEMPMPEEGVKMNLYTSLGIIAVSCIMIPCCLIVGYLSYVLSLAMMLEGNRVNGLVSEMHIIAAFSMVLGMPVVFNVLFFSADREHMVTLPIKSWELLAAKFRHTFMAESVMEFLVLFSMFIGYFLAAVESGGLWPSLHPVALAAAVIGTATTPLLPLVYCCIISLILMAVLKKVKKAKTFYRSSTVLMFLFIGLFLWSFKDMGGITMENFVDSMVAEKNFFLKVCNVIFFTTPLLCRATAEGSLLYLLAYLAGNAAAVGLMLLLGKALYSSGLYTAAALGSAKKGETKEKLKSRLHSSTVEASYFRKEWWVLLRTRAYSSNCVFINVLWPGGLLAFFLMTKKNDTIQAFINYASQGNERALLILLMGVVLVSFIASAMNTLATTAFTREGAHVDMIKYIPVTMEIQLSVKGGVALVITAPFLLLSLLVCAVFIRIPVVYLISYACVSLAALLLATMLGLALDSASPYTLWSDEYSALRGNLNSFFNMAVILVISVLFAGLAFLLYELVNVPLTAVHITLPVLLMAADILALVKLKPRILKNMEELF
ncbi:MAG: hypothetical protein IK115_10465 [Lachnospiraceae bacterium]|nr:hypothetical protein [Lachnospiraceae bacterium]